MIKTDPYQRSINVSHYAPLLVVVHDWDSLLVVRDQTGPEGLGVVVGSANQVLTGELKSRQQS